MVDSSRVVRRRVGWEIFLGALGLVVMVFYRAIVCEVFFLLWGDDDDDEPEF